MRSVATGYMQDPVVTITWRGVDVPCSYLGDYSPSENDVVLLLIQPPSVICLGRLVGPQTEDTGE